MVVMEIEIVNKRENKLLRRLELDVIIKHPNSGTPKRTVVRELIASQFKVDLDRVYIVKLISEYGVPISKGHIHIYDSKDIALEIEPDYIINRDTSSTKS